MASAKLSPSLSPSECAEFARSSEAWNRLGDRAFEWAVAPFDTTSEERAVERFLGSGRELWQRVRTRAVALGVPIGGPLALDFGCGPGRFSQALADQFDQVVGVDVAPGMVRLAERLNRRGKLCEFVVAQDPDLAHLGYGRYSLVFSAYVFQHLPPRIAQRYLVELVRLVIPGGGIVLQEHVAVDLPLVSYLPPTWVGRFRWLGRGRGGERQPERWDDYWVTPRRFSHWLASKVTSEREPVPEGRMLSAWFYATK